MDHGCLKKARLQHEFVEFSQAPCSSSGSQATRANRADVLMLGVGADPYALNPKAREIALGMMQRRIRRVREEPSGVPFVRF
jgi:hypothetical protein